MRKRSLLSALASLVLASALQAGNFTFEVKTDRPAVDYAIGEPIVFTARLLEDGQPATGPKITWIREGDDRQVEKGEASASPDTPLVVTTRSETPGFIRLKLQALDADGNPLKNGERAVAYTAGAAADTAKFEVAPEPADFDAFWARQKARVAAVPLKELERVPVKVGTAGVLGYDIKVSSAGAKPLSGYLCLPEGAQAKSLPAKIIYFGYGVYPVSKNDGAAKDSIVLSVNAHGFLNGQPREYYRDLSQGELKGYAFNEKENGNPETTYFNGMMLRLIRSLEYVKSLPEWNGRDLTVEGHSQGGLQAALAAGLDPAVTRCIANQPWMCDVGGAAMGHLRGTWHIKPTPALFYYDPVYHIRRYSGSLKLLAGLGDYVCPPSGMAALFNNARGSREIVYTQGAGHTGTARGEQFTRTAP
ncbi:acetyl xylan esterase [Opitutaceae bacterium TAV5]|nr:acetyl xylan esterase [Opitutaceae bacterium TAV5]